MMEICPFSKLPCKNKKILHITELEKGSVNEKHLCHECVEGYPAAKASNSGLLGLLSAITGIQLPATPVAPEVEPPKPILSCPGCGMTPTEISKKGRFGCARCYDFYAASVNAIISRVQDGATSHIGKHPEKAALSQDVLEQIKNLELKMANAVKVENYEIAAILKGKIEELKKKLSTGSA